MVWRIDLIYVSGTHGLVATPYETEADALAAIKAEWDRGTIQSASMEDHDYNRIEWSEIKRQLGLSEKSN